MVGVVRPQWAFRQDVDLFRQMSANELDFAKRFSVEAWKERLVGVCQRVIKAGNE